MAKIEKEKLTGFSAGADVKPGDFGVTIPEQKPVKIIGKNNSKEMQLYGAALMENLSDSRKYVLIIYGQPVVNPCFGLGEVLVTAPLWKTAAPGRTVFSQADTSWMVELYDNLNGANRTAFVGGGFLEVTTFDGKNGHANLEAGMQREREGFAHLTQRTFSRGRRESSQPYHRKRR